MSTTRTLPFQLSHASHRKSKIHIQALALVIHAAASAEGTYGQFHHGVLQCKTPVGVKSMHMPAMDDEEGAREWSDTVHEIALLRAMSKCSHRVVHTFHAVYAHNLGTMYIVTEMCQMDLREYIRRGHARKASHSYPGALIRWSRHMSEMLEVLRAFRTIHMDIKPENILVDEYGRLKLCDFGLAHFFPRDTSPWISECIAYTRWYRPPQVCARRLYSYGADVWAMGCVLYELADAICASYPTHMPLFDGSTCLLTATVPIDGRLLVEDGEVVEHVSVTTAPTMQIVCIYKLMAPDECASSVIDVSRMDDVRETREITPPDSCRWPSDILRLCRSMCRFHEKDRLCVIPTPTPPRDVLATLEHTLVTTAPKIQEVVTMAMGDHSA